MICVESPLSSDGTILSIISAGAGIWASAFLSTGLGSNPSIGLVQRYELYLKILAGSSFAGHQPSFICPMRSAPPEGIT